MGDDAILGHLAAIKEKGLVFSDKILDCEVTGRCQKYTELFLSMFLSKGE